MSKSLSPVGDERADHDPVVPRLSLHLGARNARGCLCPSSYGAAQSSVRTNFHDGDVDFVDLAAFFAACTVRCSEHRQQS
jgi:hypothetical protein